MTTPPQQRGGQADLVAWLREREANARAIAASKTGADRAGWLEDAEYFAKAIVAAGDYHAGYEHGHADATREALTSTPPAPSAPDHPSMPEHWSVHVCADGQCIVSIGNDWISGKEPEDEDEKTIIGAAQHLLSFVGYGLPPCSFDPDAPSVGGWISVEERLPKPGVVVLAFFRNKHGFSRTVRAHHAPRFTIEAAHWEDAETDDNDDGSFEPEGWYEEPALGELLTFISPESDGVVTHWMELPQPPKEKP